MSDREAETTEKMHAVLIKVTVRLFNGPNGTGSTPVAGPGQPVTGLSFFQASQPPAGLPS